MPFDMPAERPVQCARRNKNADSSTERLLYARSRSRHQYSAMSTKAAMTVLAVGNMSLLQYYIVNGSGKLLIVKYLSYICNVS